MSTPSWICIDGLFGAFDLPSGLVGSAVAVIHQHGLGIKSICREVYVMFAEDSRNSVANDVSVTEHSSDALERGRVNTLSIQSDSPATVSRIRPDDGRGGSSLGLAPQAPGLATSLRNVRLGFVLYI
jgi:hypothetical protein